MTEHPRKRGRHVSLDGPHVPLAVKEDRESPPGGDIEGHQADYRLVVVQRPFAPHDERQPCRQRECEPAGRRGRIARRPGPGLTSRPFGPSPSVAIPECHADDLRFAQEWARARGPASSLGHVSGR